MSCGRDITPPCVKPVTWHGHRTACSAGDIPAGITEYCDHHAERAMKAEREFRGRPREERCGFSCPNKWCIGLHRFTSFERVAGPLAETWEEVRERWLVTQDDADYQRMLDLVTLTPPAPVAPATVPARNTGKDNVGNILMVVFALAAMTFLLIAAGVIRV